MVEKYLPSKYLIGDTIKLYQCNYNVLNRNHSDLVRNILCWMYG